MKNNRIVDRPLQISEPTFLPEQSHRVDAELRLNLPLDETDGDVTSAPQTMATPHMTSGTLPFGGAWESGGGVGGGTSRSNVTDASAIADELRGVVRAELKKLVEVRKHGAAACSTFGLGVTLLSCYVIQRMLVHTCMYM